MKDQVKELNKIAVAATAIAINEAVKNLESARLCVSMVRGIYIFAVLISVY